MTLAQMITTKVMLHPDGDWRDLPLPGTAESMEIADGPGKIRVSWAPGRMTRSNVGSTNVRANFAIFANSHWIWQGHGAILDWGGQPPGSRDRLIADTWMVDDIEQNQSRVWVQEVTPISGSHSRSLKTRDEIETEIRRLILEWNHATLFGQWVIAGQIKALVWVVTGREPSDFCMSDLRSLFAVLGWPMPEEISLGSHSRSG